MNILYLSSVCSQRRFDDYVSKGLINKLPQAQKYHTLMLEGLRKNFDGEIIVISSYPVVGRQKSRVFRHEVESCDDVIFNYLGFYQLPFIRQICLRFNAYKEIKRFFSKHQGQQTYIVCDVLNRSIAGAALRFGRKKKVSVCGIVTDVPEHTSGARQKTCSMPVRIFKKICAIESEGQEKLYDSYLFLTEQMNAVINEQHRPYIVIEGQSDIKMADVENAVDDKEDVNIMMYAGGIHKEFGIERFVNAFIEAAPSAWQLHIYGDGNYSEDLKQLCTSIDKVKYFGVRSNEEIVVKQIRARVLVNPRFTDAEYVKYSFPSKTMECMASGTPLLTTRLPGMPKEYYSYVYFIDDESENGMKTAIQRVTSLPYMQLHEIGDSAKRFILENRNNVIQAERFCKFLCSIEG